MKTLATPDNFSARKQTIARHFANASDYDQQANIQQQVCQYLLDNLAHTKHDSILEVGAGTGQMTRLLAAHIQSQHWLILTIWSVLLVKPLPQWVLILCAMILSNNG